MILTTVPTQIKMNAKKIKPNNILSCFGLSLQCFCIYRTSCRLFTLCYTKLLLMAAKELVVVLVLELYQVLQLWFVSNWSALHIYFAIMLFALTILVQYNHCKLSGKYTNENVALSGGVGIKWKIVGMEMEIWRWHEVVMKKMVGTGSDENKIVNHIILYLRQLHRNPWLLLSWYSTDWLMCFPMLNQKCHNTKRKTQIVQTINW